MDNGIRAGTTGGMLVDIISTINTADIFKTVIFVVSRSWGGW